MNEKRPPRHARQHADDILAMAQHAKIQTPAMDRPQLDTECYEHQIATCRPISTTLSLGSLK